MNIFYDCFQKKLCTCTRWVVRYYTFSFIFLSVQPDSLAMTASVAPGSDDSVTPLRGNGKRAKTVHVETIRLYVSAV